MLGIHASQFGSPGDDAGTPDDPNAEDEDEVEDPFLADDDDDAPFDADFDKAGNEILRDAKGQPYVELADGKHEPE